MKSHYSSIPVDKKKDTYQLVAEEAEALNQKKPLPDVEPTDSEDDVEPETRLPSYSPLSPRNGTFSQNGWHLPEASSEKGKEKEKQSSKKQEQERMKKFVKAINALDGAEKLAEKFNGKTEELPFSVQDLIKDAKKTLKSDEFEDLYREYQFLKEKKNIKENLKNMRRCVEALSELGEVYEAMQTIESLEEEIDGYDKQLEEIYKQFPETYKIYQLIQELPDESDKKNRLAGKFSSSLSSQLALRPELMDEVEEVLNKQKECSEKLEEQDELDDLDASIVKLENEIIQLENSIFFKFPVRWKKNEPEELTGMRKQYSELKDRIWREKTWLLREHHAFQDDEDTFPKKGNGKKACFADGIDTREVSVATAPRLLHSTAYFKSGISPLSPYHVPKEFGKVHAAFKNNKWDYTLAPGTYEEYQRFFDEHEEDLEDKSLQEAYKLFLNIHQEHFSAYKGGIETSRKLYNDPHLEELRVPPPPSFTHGTYDKSRFDIRKQRFETIALSGEDSWKVLPSKKEPPLADISPSQYNNNNFLRRQESWRQRIQPQQESATLPAQPRQLSNNSNFELRKKMWEEKVLQEQTLSNARERC